MQNQEVFGGPLEITQLTAGWKGQRNELEEQALSIADQILNNDKLSHEFFYDFLKTQQLRQEIISLDNLNHLLENINEIISDDPYLDEVTIYCNLEDALNDYYRLGTQDVYFFPLNEYKDGHYLKLSISHHNKEYSPLHVMGLIMAIEQLEKNKKDSKDEFSYFEEAFLSIPEPVVLLGGGGELLANNPNFTPLSLSSSKCLALQDGDELVAANQGWIVRRIEIQEDEKKYLLFVFDKAKSDGHYERASVSSRELGIITGSMAHELSNPVAGILAALEVIELEEELIQETANLINEIKISALRCKRLIGIFLGLSKVDLNSTQAITLDQIISEAIDLLRVRMIESSIMISMICNEEDKAFLLEGNDVIWPMIFYIIFSEVITGHARQMLIDRSDKHRLQSFKWEISLENQNLILSCQSFPTIEKALKDSKLFNYLLGLVGRQLNFSPNSINLLKAYPKTFTDARSGMGPH